MTWLLLAAGAVRAADGTVYDQMGRDTTGAFATPEYPSRFTVGAGLVGTVGEGFTAQEPTGLSWTARYAWHPVNTFALELAYLGATTDAFVGGIGADRVSTLAEAQARVDLFAGLPICPIVAAGFGYGTLAAVPSEPLKSHFLVPLAVGVDVNVDNLVFATRFTYRSPPDRLRTAGATGADSWTLTADLGTRF